MAFDAVSFWSDEVKGGGSGKGRREKEGRRREEGEEEGRRREKEGRKEGRKEGGREERRRSFCEAYRVGQGKRNKREIANGNTANLESDVVC